MESIGQPWKSDRDEESFWKAYFNMPFCIHSLLQVATIIVSPLHANCIDEKNGNYPLHIAAQNGHINLVTWLVNNGADINAQVSLDCAK